MKKYLLFSLLLAYTCVNAQITLTDSYFPAVGDTLKTAIDGMPSGITITAPGGNQTWDFSSVQGLSRQQIILPASEGMQTDQFPDAEVLLPIGNGPQVGETYVNVTNNLYELIGYSGTDPVGFGLEVVVPFIPGIVERRAPVEFFDINTTESNILIAAASDELPGELLDMLPVTPDSIRLRVNSTRLDVVDGWGTLVIPGGEYEVLREKRTTQQETRLEAKVPLLNWLDVTDLLPFDFLGKDTTTVYHFWGNEKEAIAEVIVTNDEAETPLFVEYKDNGFVTSVPYVNTGKSDVLAYPNPAITDVRFDLLNLSSGKYTLKIFNILGVELTSKEHFVNNATKTVKVDLDSFRKGTYLYSLIDPNGKTISTKRLVIIRP